MFSPCLSVGVSQNIASMISWKVIWHFLNQMYNDEALWDKHENVTFWGHKFKGQGCGSLVVSEGHGSRPKLLQLHSKNPVS